MNWIDKTISYLIGKVWDYGSVDGNIFLAWVFLFLALAAALIFAPWYLFEYYFLGADKK